MPFIKRGMGSGSAGGALVQNGRSAIVFRLTAAAEFTEGNPRELAGEAAPNPRPTGAARYNALRWSRIQARRNTMTTYIMLANLTDAGTKSSGLTPSSRYCQAPTEGHGRRV